MSVWTLGSFLQGQYVTYVGAGETMVSVSVWTLGSFLPDVLRDAIARVLIDVSVSVWTLGSFLLVALVFLLVGLATSSVFQCPCGLWGLFYCSLFLVALDFLPLSLLSGQ